MKSTGEETKGMRNKEMLANTMGEYGKHGVKGMTECEKYGMTWGCDEDCPVLKEGKCEYWKTVEEFLIDNKK